MFHLTPRQHRSVNPATDLTALHPKHPLLNLLQIALVTLLLLTLGTNLLPRYTIQQTSMLPNFRPGQRVMVSRAERTLNNWFSGSAYAAHTEPIPLAGLHRGQVIVFYETVEPMNPPLIKRLIGMPGDDIAIHDGAVFINGTFLAEPYLSNPTTTCVDTCHLILAANEYFFLGDNRAVSRDSRQFGAITADHIIGRVLVRFWPLDQFAFFL